LTGWKRNDLSTKTCQIWLVQQLINQVSCQSIFLTTIFWTHFPLGFNIDHLIENWPSFDLRKAHVPISFHSRAIRVFQIFLLYNINSEYLWNFDTVASDCFATEKKYHTRLSRVSYSSSDLFLDDPINYPKSGVSAKILIALELKDIET
jgi:hypothetical protein